MGLVIPWLMPWSTNAFYISSEHQEILASGAKKFKTIMTHIWKLGFAVRLPVSILSNNSVLLCYK